MSTAPPPVSGPRRRGLRPTRIAAALLLLVPILEIMALIAVGQAIGGWPTFFLLVAMSILGAWLIRREGSRTWLALNQALQSGRMPARELADGMLVLVGGTLLLTPGFLTDFVGFFLVLPFTRPIARRLLEAVISRRIIAQAGPYGAAFGGAPFVTGARGSSGATPASGPAAGRPRRSPASDDVVEGEIVDD